MFGIGGTEFIVLIIIIAVLIGPDQIPGIVKGVSKFMKELTNAREDFRKSIDEDETLKEVKTSVLEIKKGVEDQVNSVTSGIRNDIDKIKQSIEQEQKKDDGSSSSRNDNS